VLPVSSYYYSVEPMNLVAKAETFLGLVVRVVFHMRLHMQASDYHGSEYSAYFAEVGQRRLMEPSLFPRTRHRRALSAPPRPLPCPVLAGHHTCPILPNFVIAKCTCSQMSTFPDCATMVHQAHEFVRTSWKLSMMLRDIILRTNL
jgi:hypothetical protein